MNAIHPMNQTMRAKSAFSMSGAYDLLTTVGSHLIRLYYKRFSSVNEHRKVIFILMIICCSWIARLAHSLLSLDAHQSPQAVRPSLYPAVALALGPLHMAHHLHRAATQGRAFPVSRLSPDLPGCGGCSRLCPGTNAIKLFFCCH
jgi:hypothetical protein